MKFKTFIYYCALCGGWAALLVWALQEFSGMADDESWWAMHNYYKAMAIALLLGLLVAGVIGLLDGLLNAVGMQRMVRVMICIAVGAIGGMVFGFIGEFIKDILRLRFIGWALVGAIIGASIGVFDVMRAVASGKGIRQAIRKMVNGIIGGTIGGAVGGAINDAVAMMPVPGTGKEVKEYLPKSTLAVGLVILGMSIGLLIGVAQVVLKEAWVRVEKGFRAGREMILTKPETTIGRAEGVDIALFGDMAVEKKHARIILNGDRYVLMDSDTPGGTTVNGQRISGPYPLSNGDMIGVGNSLVRFEERAKRR